MLARARVIARRAARGLYSATATGSATVDSGRCCGTAYPEAASGQLLPELAQARRMTEKALAAVIQEGLHPERLQE